ncbi:MAG: hypothetical protein ABSB95_12020 [Dissulfurispiraceae bacterium]|jgi:hypothetical protein
MGFKKSGIHFLLFFIAFVFVLFLTDAGAGENQWKLMGKTKDKNFLVYYDTASVKHIRKDYVSLRLKKERSAEGIEQFKKDFYASVKEAEAKAGEKVNGPVEPVMKALLERETKEYAAEIDCAKNELRLPPGGSHTVTFTIVDDIESGTSTEKIKNEVCKN